MEIDERERRTRGRTRETNAIDLGGAVLALTLPRSHGQGVSRPVALEVPGLAGFGSLAGGERAADHGCESPDDRRRGGDEGQAEHRNDGEGDEVEDCKGKLDDADN